MSACRVFGVYPENVVPWNDLALSWLREHNAGVRFESNGTVSVWANGIRRRRKTLHQATEALIVALSK